MSENMFRGALLILTAIALGLIIFITYDATRQIYPDPPERKPGEPAPLGAPGSAGAGDLPGAPAPAARTPRPRKAAEG